jgi:hypothetical protein
MTHTGKAVVFENIRGLSPPYDDQTLMLMRTLLLVLKMLVPSDIRNAGSGKWRYQKIAEKGITDIVRFPTADEGTVMEQ